MRQAYVAALFFVVLTCGGSPAHSEDRPIQDNSFLLEEAYNQEGGVVQHISAFQRVHEDEWSYAFTQEWPFRSQRHQLSYTLQYVRPAGSGGEAGPGDVALNYRYQLVGSGDEVVAMAPRLSLVIPSGDEREGRGDATWGAVVNLPVSVELGSRVVTHVNLGATYLPRAENPRGDRADVTRWNFGQSFIWLARPRLNALAEFVYTTEREVVGPDTTARIETFFVNPGIRWAHDLPSGLQIVPGLAVPIGLGPSRGERAVFVYLSFEHPF